MATRKKAKKKSVSKSQQEPDAPKKKRKKIPGSGGKPISQAELFCRLQIVEEAMIEGRHGRDIIPVLYSKGYDVPWGTLQTYIARIRKRWEEERVASIPIRRDAHRRRLNNMIRIMLRRLKRPDYIPNWSDVVKALEQLARIEGNFAPEQREIKHVDEFEGWSREELQHFIETDEEPEWTKNKNRIKEEENPTVH